MIASQRRKKSENGVIKLMITENRTPLQVLFLEFLNYFEKEKSLSPVAYYDGHIISCRLHRQTNLTSKLFRSMISHIRNRITPNTDTFYAVLAPQTRKL